MKNPLTALSASLDLFLRSQIADLKKKRDTILKYKRIYKWQCNSWLILLQSISSREEDLWYRFGWPFLHKRSVGIYLLLQFKPFWSKYLSFSDSLFPVVNRLYKLSKFSSLSRKRRKQKKNKIKSTATLQALDIQPTGPLLKSVSREFAPAKTLFALLSFSRPPFPHRISLASFLLKYYYYRNRGSSAFVLLLLPRSFFFIFLSFILRKKENGYTRASVHNFAYFQTKLYCPPVCPSQKRGNK